MPNRRKKNECQYLKQLYICFVEKNDLPREEEYMYEYHEHFVLLCTVISGRLGALALYFLFHIPVWFALTALQALQ